MGVENLTEFVSSASEVMDVNFGALMMSFGAMTSMMNYKGIHEQIGHFNLPVCYGPPMSGKTLAATCVGLALGMRKNQISSRYEFQGVYEFEVVRFMSNFLQSFNEVADRTLDFSSQDPGSESCRLWNSAHNSIAIHFTEPFIIFFIIWIRLAEPVLVALNIKYH